MLLLLLVMTMIVLLLMMILLRRKFQSLFLSAGNFRFLDGFRAIFQMRRAHTPEERLAAYGVSLGEDARCLAAVVRTTYRPIISGEHHCPVRIRMHRRPFVSREHHGIAISVRQAGNCKNTIIGLLIYYTFS